MASRGTFLKISFLALAFATSSVLGECPPNEYVPGNGCSPTPNVCEITCPKDEACGLSEGCATVGVTEDMVKDGNMTKEICPVLCQASNSTTSANPCRFWRWDIETGDNEKCYLMSEDQCNSPMSCVAPSCYHGDIGCDGEMPAGPTCPGHMTFNNEPGFIHWGCANEDGELSSPYDENNPDMPAKTICTTAYRCIDYEASENALKESESDVDEKGPVDTTTGYLAARECLKRCEYENIIGNCDQEIAMEGERSHEARLLRATFYILTKQQEMAMADLTVLIDNPEVDVKLRVNALIKRASLYIQQCKDPNKDPQLSFADFNQAVELDPDNADIYHHRGQVHLLIDQTNQAIVDFNKAVTLQPNFPVAHVQKLYTDYRAASTIGDHGTVNSVLEKFKDAIEKFPKCVETYALYAQVLNDQQEYDKADELYQAGMKVDTQNANLLVHRGLVALQAKGDVSKAVELIQSALELDEKCEFAYETLGTIEVQRGNLKRAIELFDKAIPLANTELEMGHLFGLRDAAMAQITVSTKLGITLPAMGMQ